MPNYSRKIGSDAKGCIIFLLDHSYSMVDPFAGGNRSKCDALASAINRLIAEVITQSFKGEQVSDRFDIGVIGYTTDAQNSPVIGPALKGVLAGRDLVAVPELEENPLRIEDRMIKQYDADAG